MIPSHDPKDAPRVRRARARPARERAGRHPLVRGEPRAPVFVSCRAVLAHEALPHVPDLVRFSRGSQPAYACTVRSSGPTMVRAAAPSPRGRRHVDPEIIGVPARCGGEMMASSPPALRSYAGGMDGSTASRSPAGLPSSRGRATRSARRWRRGSLARGGGGSRPPRRAGARGRGGRADSRGRRAGDRDRRRPLAGRRQPPADRAHRRGARPARRLRRERGAHALGAVPRDRGGDVGHGRRPQPQGLVLRRAGRCAADGRAARGDAGRRLRRADRLLVVGDGHARDREPLGLCRHEGGPHARGQGARPRARRARDHGERARDRGDGQRAEPRGRSRLRRALGRRRPPGAHRNAERRRRRAGVPRLRRSRPGHRPHAGGRRRLVRVGRTP